MPYKGFSASFIALDPLTREEMNLDSSEMVTPFPGYFKSVFINSNAEEEDEDEDYDTHRYIYKNELDEHENENSYRIGYNKRFSEERFG